MSIIYSPEQMVCEYCGTPRGEKLTCCGEHHFVEMFDMHQLDREWEGITASIDATNEPYTPE